MLLLLFQFVAKIWKDAESFWCNKKEQTEKATLDFQDQFADHYYTV